MIDPSKSSFVGRWLEKDAGVVGDENCQRIQLLISCHLTELARSHDGWSTLYRDPGDGRLWEHTYPQSHLHGGGPPALECITQAQAKATYGAEA